MWCSAVWCSAVECMPLALGWWFFCRSTETESRVLLRMNAAVHQCGFGYKPTPLPFPPAPPCSASRDREYRVSWYRVQRTAYSVQGTKGAGCSVARNLTQILACSIQHPGYRVQGTGYRAQGTGLDLYSSTALQLYSSTALQLYSSTAAGRLVPATPGTIERYY